MNINEKWIKKQIAYLNAHIGTYKINNNNFFFEPTKMFYKSISSTNFKSMDIAIQKISFHINCNINPSFGGWRTEPDYISNNQMIKNNKTKIEDKAGLIFSNDGFNSKIQINERYKNYPIILGAILAHEVTHHSLMEKKLYYKNKDENEKFTDLAAIFFGFGKLLLNGYLKSHKKIGYLSHENLAYSNIKICNLRNISISKLRKNLNKKSIKIINKSFSYYKKQEKRLKIKEKRRKKLLKLKKRIKNIFQPLFKILKTNKMDNKEQSEEYIKIICGECGQNMRVPKKKKTLKIKCPSCNKKIILYCELSL